MLAALTSVKSKLWMLADLQPRAFLLSEVTKYVAQILSEFGIEGYTFGEAAGDAGSRAAALQAFAGFRCAVRDHAKSGLASSSDPKDALKSILQAADRCQACLIVPPAVMCALSQVSNVGR